MTKQKSDMQAMEQESFIAQSPSSPFTQIFHLAQEYCGFQHTPLAPDTYQQFSVLFSKHLSSVSLDCGNINIHC